ncbi:SDR family oxidoreductase [Amorphoplanes nipponensis]|uniref:3-oxoacyl-ACP reductase n=1 Tax=Actinoplanes nipponensis TaxID=135950 RepID=A0A919MPY1_9ACTN|nr:SDR family oxidoreductase [Actinoplanes nipponensis]GIE49983.1 3-oxoacyl-ACP reductase [Actinoplanes nipponensis]
MLLSGKNAIIYGAGSIGGAIARAYAAEGARVFLAGRTRATLAAVAGPIGAEIAEVDALDERAVDEHADAVAATAGGIDISVNVIADHDVQGTPMTDMAPDDYLSPVVTNVRSKFLTARAAARHMKPRGSGVILTFGGSGDRTASGRFRLGGLQTAFEAVEAMRRQLATELGPYGIRVITLRTGGIPEAVPARYKGRAEIAARLAADTALGRAATLADVGRVAVFAASDHARSITGAALNMTCGAVLD